MKKTLLASLVIGFTSLIGSQQALATSLEDSHKHVEAKLEMYAPYAHTAEYQSYSKAYTTYTEAYNADTESYNDAYLAKTSEYNHYLYKDPLAIVHYVSKHYGTTPVSTY